MFGLLEKLTRKFYPKECFVLRQAGKKGKIIGIYYDSMVAAGRFMESSNSCGLKFFGSELTGVMDGPLDSMCFAYKDGRAELMLQKKAIR